MEIRIRPTGILIEDGRMLIIKQRVNPARGWSLPGGKLELGETIEQCLIREMKEETGLDVVFKELIYMTDRIRNSDVHILHISCLVERSGEKPGEYEWTHEDPAPSKSATKIREIKMQPISELESCGFSHVFCNLVKAGFPGKGAYKGDYHTFYGEEP